MKPLRAWDILDFAILASFAILVGVACGVREAHAGDASSLPAGTCDALTFAGYADADGRVEFVIPFQAEPDCDCAPGPCNVVASTTDAVIKRPFGYGVGTTNLAIGCVDKNGLRSCPPPPPPKPARIVCWGRR